MFYAVDRIPLLSLAVVEARDLSRRFQPIFNVSSVDPGFGLGEIDRIVPDNAIAMGIANVHIEKIASSCRGWNASY
ncbi:MAG: hypothetical protein U5J62_11175 [Desulfurivibrio sp.]|nr:hypothetical protein [Desulfurivibrio sp.]